ncbi:MAG: protein phosphatase 2C domain-containing protein [Clostridia bacterium]|nr:protein phosphatase 2C domain-containing protein [Clostridia bacterium]
MERSVIGKSVIGASHIRSGKECQDSFHIDRYDDGCIVIAVADGHGSNSCPYSRSGSTIAVNTFCAAVRSLHDSYSDSLYALQTYFNREGEINFAQSIEHEWKRRVLKTHSNAKREVPLTDSKEKDSNAIYMQYGTTLLGLFIAPEFTFAFQLGDGDIMRITNDKIGQVIQSDKILGVETHSLCKRNSWKSAISSVSRIDELELPTLYMLSTDGLANSYLNDDEFQKTCRDYYALIQEHGTSEIEQHLQEWLSETSANGCGDDITVVFAFLSQGVPTDE